MSVDKLEKRRIFLVAGEESGDQLGSKLMESLRSQSAGTLEFFGVGGRAMAAKGLHSLFPLEDIAVMGITAVIGRLRTLIDRINRTANAAVACDPDVLVIIDSPDFTHRVARKVRQKAPHIPIVDYVSPSVWAWRPGRARKMHAYVDQLLAILPFEPEVHKKLGGPPCTYVGHPLIERISEFRPRAGERTPIGEGRKKLLVLPGSRYSEVSRLMEPFGQTIAQIEQRFPGEVDIIIPAVPHLADEIAARAEGWPLKPTIIHGEENKLAAFRSAHAALAASGTATLELALSGVPMVVGYRVSKLEEQLRHLIKVSSIVLANLVLQENVIPELVQWDCTPDKLAGELLPLLENSEKRAKQVEAFARLDNLMEIGAEKPSERAARIVLEAMHHR